METPSFGQCGARLAGRLAGAAERLALGRDDVVACLAARPLAERLFPLLAGARVLLLDDERVPARGIVILGDHEGAEAVELIDELADALGWPVIAEPSGNGAGCSTALWYCNVTTPPRRVVAKPVR